MALTNELLDLLACPACRSRLEPEKGQKSLNCTGCKETYPIREGIPFMMK